MTSYKRIKSVKSQGNPQADRIIVGLTNEEPWTIKENALKKFDNGDELKAALDLFLGYVIDDIWFHLNRDDTWAIATGQEPLIWPEDMPREPKIQAGKDSGRTI